MEINNKIIKLLDDLRERTPLVHQITNYVTVNDCANITLAIGGSPVMADDINEVLEMVSLSSSLVINIGTLNSRSVESMIKAGKRANELKIPVILDPVGAGATSYRTEVCKRIISEVRLAVIRGNLSEIKTIYGIDTITRGVDASESFDVSGDEFTKTKEMARKFAVKFVTVVAITGEVDIITDGKILYTTSNGHKMMSRVTGTGCMCTAVIGCYLGAGENNLIAALAGVVSMGIAGETAYERLDKKIEGSGTFRMKMIDVMYNLCEVEINKRSKINEE
ncbi:hydroxyethylthiazole kinase [Clostridium estertheticum]|uniref:Hydroxyethylthiazole kinase n=1 Tax=Clostridium estertheticum subsp. estertheticum TaxID=1552 RepID=A0A1J0GEH1_9CLOT|nr:hydroxyethylthiazole kinase [Clostridium estertheticum]APC39764.1 hydroxyethylthiazole kinase [Clostridium estertheticum subsp. estertheticum]MBU3185069.1 hydroxyethylthiazole kinase [Clostridium estertheticum]MBZ9614189.1 hydroxyethylthiazole kinase [Clostridium estertheticum subsp. laramiense]WAG74134.1 hydroxyethylthiazole kinase [Clostridium estertheticum]